MAEGNQTLTHFDNMGNAIMVDVSEKHETSREAVAHGRILVGRAVMDAILGKTAAKGDVLGVARVAGIMATKRTSELIPLCHILLLTHCAVEFTIDEAACEITAICTVRVNGKTGVEMEALTGVSVTLLTIYDMCKALDKGMRISEIELCEKRGGKSGYYRNERATDR